MSYRYFSIDEEFSGLDHRKNCLLSVGIIEINYHEKINTFLPNFNRTCYVELKPTGEINEESMKINGLNLDNLQKFGVDKKNAIKYYKICLNNFVGDF